MDFEIVLKRLITAFNKNNIHYGLIGGFALGLYKVVRSTNDLDFLIDAKHRNLLKDLMKKNLYELVHESENVIQFEHPTGAFGTVDFLYAYRQPSLEMLKRVVKIKILNETLELNVLKPEDIIGLKVQAFINKPARQVLEVEDIKHLIETQGNSMDWEIIKKHFDLFSRRELFDKLKSNYEQAKNKKE